MKVDTDAGVHGWGEASLVNQTPAIAASIELLGRQIMGQDPAAIERLWQIMYLHNRYRGGVVINSALSAIDQALWDIKGKVLDAPVYQLLGGAVRGTIRVYAGAGDPEQARERIAEGFAGVKTGGGWHGSDHAVDDRRAPEVLRRELLAIRDALPPDAELMVDNHGHSRPADAIRADPGGRRPGAAVLRGAGAAGQSGRAGAAARRRPVHAGWPPASACTAAGRFATW